MRSVDLAIFADGLAAEAASLAARAEQTRSRLRQAALEREARAALPEQVIARLEALGALRNADEPGLRERLAELEGDLDALLDLQEWVEERLRDAQAADDVAAARATEAA